MKKYRYYFLIVFAMFIMLPFSVNALDVNSTSEFVDALGGNNYATLSTDAKTITLQNDVVLSETLTLSSGEYILDLNGKSISDDANSFIGDNLIYIENATLTIDDLVGNGGIYVNNSDDRVIFVSYGNLIINNAIIKGNWNALFVMNSTLKIYDGTFTGVKSSAMYSYNSDIVINDGDFSGYSEALMLVEANTTINNGNFTSYGEEKSTALVVSGGKAYINGGMFEGNYVGLSASIFGDYDIKIKGGIFTGLNKDTSVDGFASAGITMNLADGLNSTIDATHLLADGCVYYPTDIKTYETYEDGIHYISATNSSVKVVPKNSIFNVINNSTNIINNGPTTVLSNTEYKTIIKANDGYKLPDMVYILINGGSELSTSSYSYNNTTGELVISALMVTGNIVIVGDAIPVGNDESYKVIFDANGGTFKDGQNILTIEKWNIGDEEKLEKPIKEGYEFLGYFTDKNDGTSLEMYIAEAGIDNDMTFYAKWEKVEEVPKTLDSLETSIIIGVISLVGLVGASMYLVKRNKVKS